MEALGAVSAAIAVADATAVGVRKTILTLRRLRKAPQELYDLLEQVDGITLVLKVVSEASRATDVAKGLGELLKQLQRQLLGLEQLIHFKLVKPNEELEVDRLAWVHHQPEISKRIGSIHRTTNCLAITLSAMTILQTTHLQKQIEHSSVATGSSSHEAHLISSLVGKLDGLTVLCEKIQYSPADEHRVSEALAPLQQTVAQNPQDSHHSGGQSLPTCANDSTPSSSDRLQESISFRLNEPKRTADALACLKPCRCQCHKRWTFRLPSSLRYWLGTLYVSIANSRYSHLRCNVVRCRRRADTSVTVQYLFPSSFAAAMISAYYKKSSWGSVDRLIRVVQVVESDAFHFARKRDLPSLREIYSKGRASVHDVSPISGYTALIEAIMNLEFDVVRFLLQNGADTTQGDLYGIDAETTALERFFQPVQQDIRQRTEFPELVNLPDAIGRTPLFWAVWLNDLQSMELLLLNEADISPCTDDGRTVFHLMAQSRLGPESFSILNTRYTKSAPSASNLRFHINRQDSGGNSTFHHAIQYSHWRGTRLLTSLLDVHPDFSLKSTTFGRNSFHYICMHGDAATIACLFRDLSTVDLLATDIHGNTAMDFLLARLRKLELWAFVPPHCQEDAIALMKFVTHARRFESRLPRIVDGPRVRNKSQEPGFHLLRPSDHTLGAVYGWPAWADVEEWVVEHGDLEIPDTVESEVEISQEGNNHENHREDGVGDGIEEDKETFFDASDTTQTHDIGSSA